MISKSNFGPELRRWEAQLGPSARITAGCLRLQELPALPQVGPLL
jgi:hypothetical protein